MTEELSDYPEKKPRIYSCPKCHLPSPSYNAITGLCPRCFVAWKRIEKDIYKEWLAGEFLERRGEP